MFQEKLTQSFESIIHIQPRKYRAFNLKNFKEIPQIRELSDQMIFDMEVAGNVLPFKANNYVTDQLIDWTNIPDDPIFRLTFPQKEMLKPYHYEKMAATIKSGASRTEIAAVANNIRSELNPNPSGQKDFNVPYQNGEPIPGMQHKYRETALFFPSQGQTCHAYCTFCFRWSQFTGMSDHKFASKEIKSVIKYLKEHSEISDLLLTGGDPMVMSGDIFRQYIDAILDANITTLKTIRIGTKTLAYWPYRYVTDPDADTILKTFEKITRSGKQVAFMAHFNHYKELSTDVVKLAVRRINNTGAIIRTQSPVFRYINADPKVWEKMWRQQTKMKMVPYYMFLARDTGAQHYFKVPLVEAWKIFREAYNHVSGTARTVRGPVMSCDPGKIQILGVSKIHNEKVFVLRFIQGRNKDWVHRPFFAKYDPDAIWYDELKPAFGEKKFFFEEELQEIYDEKTKILDESKA